MSKILSYLRHLFSDEPEIENVIQDTSVDEADVIDRRPFWEGLPSLGPDQEARIAGIKAAHPIHYLNPDPYVSRRKLYKSILSLRTETKRGWIADQKVEKINFA